MSDEEGNGKTTMGGQPKPSFAASRTACLFSDAWKRIPELKAVPSQFTRKVEQFGRLLHVSITTGQRMK